MKIVREILQKKGHQIWSVSSEASVYEALKQMAEKNIGALLVMDKNNVAGIISERDYARKVVLEGKSSRDAKVKEIMSDKVIYVESERMLDECMALMIEKRIRHLPVYENDRLTGMISIGDVVKAVIDEKEFVIDQLVQYITNTPAIIQEEHKSVLV
ncbi:MAG TPA: CBS domain-containing protein [Ignavibacteriaceae bacterium]|nr:CBS domain-containing protein [Ignavibacteriaceae bacterium]